MEKESVTLERQEERREESRIKPHPIKINMDGITLEMMLTQLVQEFGWEVLAKTIRVNCLSNDPSIKSSLNFFRKTPWARKKLEDCYLRFRRDQARRQARIAEPAPKPPVPETSKE